MQIIGTRGIDSVPKCGTDSVPKCGTIFVLADCKYSELVGRIPSQNVGRIPCQSVGRFLSPLGCKSACSDTHSSICDPRFRHRFRPQLWDVVELPLIVTLRVPRRSITKFRSDVLHNGNATCLHHGGLHFRGTLVAAVCVTAAAWRAF